MHRHSEFQDSEYLTKAQYHSAANLAARIRLHQQFSTVTEPLPRMLFNHYLSHAPDNAHILGLGSGRGDLWHDNAERIPASWTITLTDLSDGMLADQRAYLGDELSTQIQQQVVDAVDIPFSDNSFDIVSANYMLYHVEDLPRALSEIRRVLKPDGTLFAATNGKNHLKMIYVLAQAINEDDEWSSVVTDKFSLQNGTAHLMSQFTDIRMIRSVNDLWVTEAQPIIDYIASMIGIDGAAVIAEKEVEIRQGLNRRIALDGGILIGKETGLFIARGDYDTYTPPNHQ